MKNLFVLMLFVAATFAANAQVTVSVKKVDAAEVPQAVLDAQESYFAGTTVNLWEKQSASARDRSGARYVANFQLDGQKARARYYANGTGISATSYYVAKELPQDIQDAAATNYGGYRLNSGEKIMLLNQNETIYRLRLRKGAQKLVVYVDENGDEISRSEVPDEVEAEEGVE